MRWYMVLQRRKVLLKTACEELIAVEKNIVIATNKHNQFLEELGLPKLPLGS